MPQRHYQLGVIGTGMMGAGLVRGFIAAEAVAGDDILAYDIDSQRLADLVAEVGVVAAEDNQTVVEQSQTVLIAIKPQLIAQVLAPEAAGFAEGQLLISIAAGIRLAQLREMVGPQPALVRVMPNILCAIGQGAAAYSLDDKVTVAQQQIVEKLLGSVGTVAQVEERLMDAVTGLSGSGPAFAAVFIEALADGGVTAGLPRDVALQLAAQTVAGAGQWVLDEGNPARLKDQVTSPGGTTAAGLAQLEAHGLRSAALEAVVAAARRSEQLGMSGPSQ